MPLGSKPNIEGTDYADAQYGHLPSPLLDLFSPLMLKDPLRAPSVYRTQYAPRRPLIPRQVPGSFCRRLLPISLPPARYLRRSVLRAQNRTAPNGDVLPVPNGAERWPLEVARGGGV